MVVPVPVRQRRLRRTAVKTKRRRLLPKKSTSSDARAVYLNRMLILNRLSREDREAKYAAARERIFGRAEKNGENGQGKTLFAVDCAGFKLTPYLQEMEKAAMTCLAQVLFLPRTGRLRTDVASPGSSVETIPRASIHAHSTLHGSQPRPPSLRGRHPTMDPCQCNSDMAQLSRATRACHPLRTTTLVSPLIRV